jgi:hypothetical protein
MMFFARIESLHFGLHFDVIVNQNRDLLYNSNLRIIINFNRDQVHIIRQNNNYTELRFNMVKCLQISQPQGF